MNNKELEIAQNFFIEELKKRNPAFFGTIHLNLDEHKYNVMELGLNLFKVISIELEGALVRKGKFLFEQHLVN